MSPICSLFISLFKFTIKGFIFQLKSQTRLRKRKKPVNNELKDRKMKKFVLKFLKLTLEQCIDHNSNKYLQPTVQLQFHQNNQTTIELQAIVSQVCKRH